MAEHTQTNRRAVVVSLAAYRATRQEPARWVDPGGRRLLALRLPGPRETAHRRRMLAHLAGKP